MAYWSVTAALYSAVLFLRYARFCLDLIQCYGFCRLRARVKEPSIIGQGFLQDVTITCMTLGSELQHGDVIKTWLKQNPKAVLICTTRARMSFVKEVVEAVGDERVSVICVEAASARRQQSELVRRVKTDFFVMTDDRAKWSSQTLQRVLAPFENPRVGGVTSVQEVKPVRGSHFTLWERFGALNLQRRNVQHAALAYLNEGQVLNLSGRLSAFRTRIYQRQDFYNYLLNDLWLGQYHITTGDDNAFTTWLLQHGWKTSFVAAEDAILLARVCSDSLYLRQLLRWLRDTLRYYMVDLAFSMRSRGPDHILRSVSNMVIYFITDISMSLELVHLVLAALSFESQHLDPTACSVTTLCYQHIIASILLTTLEHFTLFTSLKRFTLLLPVLPLYLYVRTFVFVYALLSLNKSVWGSRSL